MKRRVLAIILAAGKSVRFGKQKLLQPFFGSPLILRTIRPFLDFQLIDEVIVVVGFRKDEMIEVLKPYAVRIVVNEDYERGLSSSILAALPFVGDDDEVFIHLGDKPFVKASLLKDLIGSIEEKGNHIIVPTYKGNLGHPVLVGPGSYLKEISKIEGDEGLRRVILKRPGTLKFLESDRSVIIDIDTLTDLERLQEEGLEIEESKS